MIGTKGVYLGLGLRLFRVTHSNKNNLVLAITDIPCIEINSFSTSAAFITSKFLNLSRLYRPLIIYEQIGLKNSIVCLIKAHLISTFLPHFNICAELSHRCITMTCKTRPRTIYCTGLAIGTRGQKSLLNATLHGLEFLL